MATRQAQTQTSRTKSFLFTFLAARGSQYSLHKSFKAKVSQHGFGKLILALKSWELPAHREWVWP